MSVRTERMTNETFETHSAWTRITSIEQRRRYKSEFDQMYVEYRKMHLYQDEISKRFQQLETQLKYEKERCNEPMCTVSVFGGHRLAPVQPAELTGMHARTSQVIRNKIQEEYLCTMDRDEYKNNVKR